MERKFNDPVIDFDKAVKLAGNQSKLAKYLDIERATVSLWKKEGYFPPLPSYRVIQIWPELDERK